MRWIVCFTLLSFVSLSFAQRKSFELERANWLFEDSTNMYHLSADAFFYAQSNAISNEMYNKIAYGNGPITARNKESVYNKLGDLNFFGMEYQSQMNFSYQIKPNDLALRIFISDREFIHGNFTQDLFSLVADGNRKFAGQTANAGPSEMQWLSYQSIGAGIEKMFKDQSLIIGINASVITGSRYQNTTMQKADVYTDPDGKHIDLDVDYEMMRTQTVDRRFLGFNGTGFAFQAYLTKRFDENHQLHFGLYDMGVIAWSNTSVYDTLGSYRFQGASLDNMFSGGEVGESDYSGDNVNEVLDIEPTTETRLRTLPIRLFVSYEQQFSQHFHLMTSLNYFGGIKNFPRLEIYPEWVFNDKIAVSLPVGVGGFSNLDVGMGVDWSFYKDWNIRANMFYLEALLLPHYTNSQGVSVGFNHSF